MKAALVMLACCTGGDHATTVQYDDTGTLCLCASMLCSGPQHFQADQPVYVTYALPGLCLSSSCMIDRMMSCVVTATGSTLHATTAVSYIDVSGGGTACTADCGFAGAACETDSLPAGSYTVELGTHTVALTIPSQVDAAPCVTN